MRSLPPRVTMSPESTIGGKSGSCRLLLGIVAETLKAMRQSAAAAWLLKCSVPGCQSYMNAPVHKSSTYKSLDTSLSTSRID